MKKQKEKIREIASIFNGKKNCVENYVENENIDVTIYRKVDFEKIRKIIEKHRKIIDKEKETN